MGAQPRLRTLYDPRFEHDACGVGFVAAINGAKSRTVLDRALEAVENVTHRGAVSADAKTGDGAGVVAQIPPALFYPVAEQFGFTPHDEGDLAVGVVFLPQDETARARTIVEHTVKEQRLLFLGWREAPVDPSALGEQALATMPRIEHVLVGRPPDLTLEGFPRRLYLARKQAERAFVDEGIAAYVASFSNRTIVYKGLLVAPQLRAFYPDLDDPAFETALAVLHQRYSTNTFPNWELAQPFRTLGHNGEINTLQGNRNWMQAREPELRSWLWGDDAELLVPVLQEGVSDSASLDNVLELLMLSGRDALHAMMMLVPEAWENMPRMEPSLRAFYEYHATLTEPWDGPAALAFTDGTTAAAVLDRNGLRPARYKVGDDNIFVMASEVGAVEMDDAHVVEKGRLGPGQMIAVDTASGTLLRNDDIKERAAAAQPYGEWLERRLYALGEIETQRPSVPDRDELARLQRSFAYTTEEAHLILRPLYAQAVEPVGSLGDDTPLSILAAKPRLLSSYFKQRFAQVTNPPIDPLREQLVMSLYTYLGPRGSLLEETEEHAGLLRLDAPVLADAQLAAVREDVAGLGVTTLSALYGVASGGAGLESALTRLSAEAEAAVDDGAGVLIISDKGVDSANAAIPMLLAVGAVHNHLIRARKRMRASIVAETGEARDPHQVALLIGYGASAVNPYLAFATVADLIEVGHDADVPTVVALANYLRTINKQLLKIMSKMGISTVSAYHGAQIFEAIGLSDEVVECAFAGTPSPIGGIGFDEIAAAVQQLHTEAFAADWANGAKGDGLVDHGYYRYRRGGEPHGFSPGSVRILHKALEEEGTGQSGYEQYVEMVHNQAPISLRDLLRIKHEATPVPLDEVEPASSIVKRFNGGSMSFGALSIEAHQGIASAYNMMDSKSGSGEGGEDPRRFRELSGGVRTGSRMKQVASGRFGVTPEYLALADVLEIKMAQGSKPGEGGQLPGHKVTDIIATARRTQPGVPLISPPPHHDIYSIEDLAQLIYDLKAVNPRATVAVKLVAEAGVGTIAAGVAKGYADYVLISGGEGGTGASPWISIKYAGSPWELGVVETQQVLVENDLRGRITLRTDGGLKTGEDIAIAAMLGAEEFGFGTAAMVAVGCQIARQCHLNTCPVGVATQDPELRAKYWGAPEMLVRYMFFIAEELRTVLASLGVRNLDDIVGRSDLLEQIPVEGAPNAHTIDLSRLLAPADPTGTRPVRRMQERNDRLEDNLLDDVLLPQVRPAIDGRQAVKIEREIRNVHRTVGARIAGEIAYIHGDSGLPEHSIDLRFRGSAGQSFGAFLLEGMHLTLEGEANDYVGKGMHGGELVLRPPDDAPYHAHDNVIMGNTVLYGATGGRLFAAGRAGERFAVRNSGAWAVVEGVGDHACEYMTGGVVVVLGPVGRNIGAGMSGGAAFALDIDGSLDWKVNLEMVGIETVDDPEDEGLLHTLILRHHEMTRSARAEDILDNWSSYLPLFRKVTPLPHIAPPPPREQERQRRDALLAVSQRRGA